MRVLWLFLAGGALTACGKSAADGKVEFAVAGLNAIAPQSMGGGMMMRKAVADGSRLILMIDGARTRDLEATDFDSQVRSAICNDPNFRKFISEGIDLTIDLTAGSGRNVKVTVTSC